MKFQPLTNRVLIKELPKKEKTAGGIILPDNVSKEPLIEGIAKVVGSKVETVKEGYHVLYSASAGGIISIDGDDYALVFEDDIWGIF